MLHVHSFCFNPFSENTYLVNNDEKKAVLIDPGNWNEAENNLLKTFVEEQQLQLQDVLLTHAHIDHVLGLQWASDTFSVGVKMHEEDLELLKRNPMTAKSYGFNFAPFEGQIAFLDEGQQYALGEEVLDILHIPGHSPGSIAFYSEAHHFIVSGDALFEGSIGRTDLYRGDYGQLIRSISEKLFTLPPETKVFSGHGHPTQVGREKQYNPFFQ